jgi:hypothetical protein
VLLQHTGPSASAEPRWLKALEVGHQFVMMSPVRRHRATPSTASNRELDTFRPFGLLDQTLGAAVLDGVYERMARALHAAYLRRPLEPGEWEAVPEHFKASSRAQAVHTGAKLREVECGLVPLTDTHGEPFRFTPSEIELLAVLEHDRWRDWTASHGYRHGDRRVDRSALVRRVLPWMRGRHPMLVPWDDLDDDAREIDREFIRRLPPVLAAVDQQVVRLDDRLARAIHLSDRVNGIGRSERPAGDLPWDDLLEAEQDQYRDRAALLRLDLRAAGLALVPDADGPAPSGLEGSSETDPHLPPRDALQGGAGERARVTASHELDIVRMAGYRVVGLGRGQAPSRMGSPAPTR